MPSDLNVKKSWHPGLAKNRAKVLKREKEFLEEHKRTEERLKEIAKERELEELRAMQGCPAPSKVAWMYSEAKGGTAGANDKEAYLLGRKQVTTEKLAQNFEERLEKRRKRDDQRKLDEDPMAALFRQRKSQHIKSRNRTHQGSGFDKGAAKRRA